MRVYEISKQLGVSSKEVLEALNNKGFNVHSHMASLPEDAVAFLNQSFKKQPVQPVQPEKPKQQAPQPTMTIPSESKQKKVSPIPPVKHEEKKALEVKQVVNVETERKIIPPEQLILVIEPMTVAEFAQRTHRAPNEIIISLLKKGLVYTINQLLSTKIVEQLAEQYGIKTAKPEIKNKEFKSIVKKTKGKVRLPVVVVIGHVDHGKTTLLDYIRKTKVAAKEKGGITQHLGAYQVDAAQGSLVFLDTPGHEAFTKIRVRGLNVADLAILVVAADDGVMPQTIEAIKHAQAAGIPIIVAINKIDKVTPVQIEKVKRDLVQYNLLSEEWGGQTIIIPISAKLGTGIDTLLEMIVLQSELMELKADESAIAQGFILEAKMEKGRGPVATLILHQGTLHLGDFFVAGSSQGKINSIVDSHGNHLKHVGPSVPVQIAGFDQLPDVGQFFEVVTKENYKTAKTKEGTEREIKHFISQDSVNLIIKTDNRSSKEAVIDAIAKISKHSKKNINVIYSSVGDITESDIDLAYNTQSNIYGFHVKVESNALIESQKTKVPIKLFMVIYKLLEDVEELVKEKVEPKKELIKIGTAEVRKVFDIKNIGVIAGAYVKEGRIARNGQIVIMRNNQKIGQGAIKSLERDRKPVKEVHKGFECAFLVEGFNDWQVDDKAECFVTKVAESQ